MKWLSSLFLVLIPIFVFAQAKTTFTNATTIDENRYAGFKGSAYLYDDWKVGNVYDTKGKAFERVEINFNGYSNEIEIKKGDKYINLDQKWYLKIEVEDKEGIRIYHRGIHDFFKDKFVEVIHQGTSLMLVKKFRVGVTEKEINDVGKTIKIKRFERKEDYYFIKNGKLQNIKFKKKSIIKYLGHKKELERYIKDNKLKLNRLNDLKKVLTFYEEQGF